ncbi:MAG: response regulator [Bryobacteraceae bacterium]
MQDEQYRVLMVEDNAGDARLVEELLTDAKCNMFRVHCARSLVSALDMLSRVEFDVAMVDLSLPDSEGLNTFLEIHRHAPHLPIVVVTGLDNNNLAVLAVQQGAQDYITKAKLTADGLVRALKYGIARAPSERKLPDVGNAKVIGVLGAKGGVGTTTIACHSARELSKQTKQKVLLMETDASTAGAAFLMQVKSPHSLLDAEKSVHRLDQDLWKSIVSSASEGVDLLQSPGTVRITQESRRAQDVLRFATSLYDWIVLDLGRLNETSQDLLAQTADLFLVTVPDVAAMAETKRALKGLLELNFASARTHLILNRTPRGLSIEGQAAFGYAIYETITDESDELQQAYRESRFLDDKLKLSKQTAKLVTKWLGTEIKQPSPRGLSRLVSRAIGRI